LSDHWIRAASTSSPDTTSKEPPVPSRANRAEPELSRPLSEVKADLFKALAHPARIRALEVLVEGERSVGELQPLVGVESSHLSQQLGVLRRAGLVATRKEGSSVIYSLRDPLVADLLAVAKRFLRASLTETRDLLDDLTAELTRR
jgi:ArsR family transcriptional regulator